MVFDLLLELEASTSVNKKFKYKRETFHQFDPGDKSKTVFGKGRNIIVQFGILKKFEANFLVSVQKI